MIQEAFADLIEQPVAGNLHRDVVRHRDRLRANAENVIGVHGYAVDPYRVVAVHHLRHDRLCSDAIRRDCQSLLSAHVEDTGEMTKVEKRAASFGP